MSAINDYRHTHQLCARRIIAAATACRIVRFTPTGIESFDALGTDWPIDLIPYYAYYRLWLSQLHRSSIRSSVAERDATIGRLLFREVVSIFTTCPGRLQLCRLLGGITEVCWGASNALSRGPDISSAPPNRRPSGSSTISYFAIAHQYCVSIVAGSVSLDGRIRIAFRRSPTVACMDADQFSRRMGFRFFF